MRKKKVKIIPYDQSISDQSSNEAYLPEGMYQSMDIKQEYYQESELHSMMSNLSSKVDSLYTVSMNDRNLVRNLCAKLEITTNALYSALDKIENLNTQMEKMQHRLLDTGKVSHPLKMEELSTPENVQDLPRHDLTLKWESSLNEIHKLTKAEPIDSGSAKNVKMTHYTVNFQKGQEKHEYDPFIEYK